MVVFDTFGDQFIGVKTGKFIIPVDREDPDSETFTQFCFRNADGYFGINAGYKLLEALDKVPDGSLTRITYVKDIETGQPSPMRDFRVEVAASTS